MEKRAVSYLGEMPEPELRDDEVLVKVHATSVDLLDVKDVKYFGPVNNFV